MARKGLALETPSGGSNAPRWGGSCQRSIWWLAVRMPSETSVSEIKERDLARRALELKIEEGLKSVREGRVVDGEEAMAELIGELKTRRKDAGETMSRFL